MASGGRPLCPLCHVRRGKRLCPAKGAEICAHCCGTKRRVEIDCPADCVYLVGDHAAGWDGRETERRRDARRVAPFVEGLTEDQVRLFLVALGSLSDLRAHRSDLDDSLLGQALSAYSKTLDTQAKGILYEHRADDFRAQAVVSEIRQRLEAEGRPEPRPKDGDLRAVIGALAACVAAAIAEREGPATFLDTAQRLAGRLEGQAQTQAKPLIVEP